MANIYKDNDKRKKVVPGGTQIPQDEGKAPETVETPAETEAPSDSKPTEIKDILENVKAAKKRKPKRKTFSLYLSVNVMNEIEKQSKKADMSASEYLDEILKDIFNLN